MVEINKKFGDISKSASTLDTAISKLTYNVNQLNNAFTFKAYTDFSASLSKINATLTISSGQFRSFYKDVVDLSRAANTYSRVDAANLIAQINSTSDSLTRSALISGNYAKTLTRDFPQGADNVIKSLQQIGASNVWLARSIATGQASMVQYVEVLRKFGPEGLTAFQKGLASSRGELDKQSNEMTKFSDIMAAKGAQMENTFTKVGKSITDAFGGTIGIMNNWLVPVVSAVQTIGTLYFGVKGIGELLKSVGKLAGVGMASIGITTAAARVSSAGIGGMASVGTMSVTANVVHVMGGGGAGGGTFIGGGRGGRRSTRAVTSGIRTAGGVTLISAYGMRKGHSGFLKGRAAGMIPKAGRLGGMGKAGLLGLGLGAADIGVRALGGESIGGEDIGGLVGGGIGAAAGSLLGPLGTIAGGMLGSWIGGKIGGAISGKSPEAQRMEEAAKEADEFTNRLEKLNNKFRNINQSVNDVIKTEMAGLTIEQQLTKEVEVRSDAIKKIKEEMDNLVNSTSDIKEKNEARMAGEAAIADQIAKQNDLIEVRMRLIRFESDMLESRQQQERLYGTTTEMVGRQAFEREMVARKNLNAARQNMAERLKDLKATGMSEEEILKDDEMINAKLLERNSLQQIDTYQRARQLDTIGNEIDMNRSRISQLQSMASITEILYKNPLKTLQVTMQQLPALQREAEMYKKLAGDFLPGSKQRAQYEAEYLGTMQKITSLMDYQRRTWMDQMSALSINLTTGSYVFKDALSNIQALGPAFAPFAGGGPGGQGQRGWGTYENIFGGPMRSQGEQMAEQLVGAMKDMQVKVDVKIGDESLKDEIYKVNSEMIRSGRISPN